MEYPYYRKNAAGNSFFRIISDNEFYELKVNKTFYSLYHIIASVHPERMLIQDMVVLHEGFYSDSSAEEFIDNTIKCVNNLRRV